MAVGCTTYLLRYGLIAGLAVVSGTVSAETLCTVSGLGLDQVSRLDAVRAAGTTFLNLDDIQNSIAVEVIVDVESRIGTLAGPGNCVAFYLDDETEYREIDGKRYVSAAALGGAFDATIRKSRKQRIDFQCEQARSWPRPGSEVGRQAPGFVLRNADSAEVRSRDLLANGGLILAFVRSGGWDPFSMEMLRSLSANREAFAKQGFVAVATHGYGCSESRKWADSLKVDLMLLSDPNAAVMRGFDVFDEGLLPVCSIVMIGSDGRVRWRKEFAGASAVFDVAEILAHMTAD
ncbi:redoxin domain-containing protein [candidate division KSB1 bacterium]|nr:redoxin domain-containing protein [candidate division KSB1 bacterium]